MAFVGLALLVIGTALAPVAAVLFLSPTHVYVDTNNSQDIFFSCGGALYPGAEPHEEPGISACEDTNDTRLRAGLLVHGSGALSAVLGAILMSFPRHRAADPNFLAPRPQLPDGSTRT